MHRPLSFVKYLGDYNWRPTVVAPRGEDFWIQDSRLVDEIPDNVTVIRTESLSGQAIMRRARGKNSSPSQSRSSRGFGVLRRAASALLMPDTYVGWKRFALAAARDELRKGDYDAVYSTSPPETSQVIGSALKKEFDLPWLVDFRDPWMNLHLLSPPSPWHRRRHRSMEAQSCRAEAVVVTTQWHQQLLQSSYPNARVERISNGYDGNKLMAFQEARPADAKLTITHTGMLTQNRTATFFLEGLRRMLTVHPEARERLCVQFIGPREDHNERAATELGLDDVVRFLDTMTHRDALQAQADSHILLLIKHVNDKYTGLVPGKLYEYLGLRRPILALAPSGEAADLVARHHRGEVVANNDSGAIAAVLAAMFKRYRDGDLFAAYQLNPLPQYDRRHLAGDLASLLESISS